MSDTYPCPSTDDDQPIHRYVAGTLEQAEVTAFEIHLLECATCQDAVHEGAAVRRALRDRRGRGRSPRGILTWMVPLTAAAAVAGVVWWVAGESPLRALSSIDAVPAFDGLPAREESASAGLIERGMAAYAEGDFDRAAALLGQAAGGDSSPGVAFYLGVARLKVGDAAGATAALAGATRHPPYAAEAGLFRAKAWLAQERADSALAALQTVPADGSAASRHASALADSIRAVRR